MKKPRFPVHDIFIKLCTPEEHSLDRCIAALRSQIDPLILHLEKEQLIEWYFFLIHNRKSGGIPTSPNDRNLYYHLRFRLRDKVSCERLLKATEEILGFTPLWRTTNKPAISGRIEKAKLKNEEFEEAWKIMGEQSEWILHMIRAHNRSIDRLPCFR